MKTKLRSSVNATFYNGLSDIIVKSLTSGPLLSAYALCLGMGNIVLGLLQSVVPFSNLLHLVVAYFLEKDIPPKKIAYISSLLSRPLLLLLAISFFFKESSYGPFLFVFSYTLFYMLVAVTGGAFWPWCKAFVPKLLITSFFAHRIRFILLVRVLTVTAATSLLSFINSRYPSGNLFIYPFFLFLAFIAGLFYTYTLYKMQDVKLQSKIGIPFLKKIHLAFKNKGFVRLFLDIGLANLTLSFFTPFSIVFLMQDLELPVSMSILFSIESNCIDILCVGLWQRCAHRKSLTTVLFYSTFFFVTAIAFLAYLSFYRVNIFPCLIIAFLLIGIGGSGINLAISDTSISYVPSKMSSIYISLMNVGRFSFAGLGSFGAGFVIEALGYCTSYKWLFFFLLCEVFFLASGVFCRKIKPINDGSL